MKQINLLYPKGIYRVSPKKKVHFRWLYSGHRKCEYCGITECMYMVLKTYKDGSRGLTKDHVNAFDRYTEKVLACCRCNQTKSHHINYKDMKEIGPKYIAPVWDTMGQKKYGEKYYKVKEFFENL